MEGPILDDKLHRGARRVSAYALPDGKYQILEDALVVTRYGPQRSVVIQPENPQAIVCFIPKSLQLPEGNLVGKTLEKKDLESTYPRPSIGVTYSIEIQ
jgi:hypothetical protein